MSSTLKRDADIVKVIKNTLPAVVTIVLTRHLDELEAELSDLHPVADMGNDPSSMPENRVDTHGRVNVGGGSGFIVDKSGIILTNKHVIAESHVQYTVILSDGSRHEAQVLAADPLNDVAVLKINGNTGNFPFLALGNSHKLELGETVLAIGNVLGVFRNTVSKGIISGLYRTFSAQTDKKSPSVEMRGLIQTDAAINPGNSGGPLVNGKGEVIGINTAIASDGQNISFAIPIQAAERDLNDLNKFGRIRRPLLGVRYITLNPDLQERLKTKVNYGAYVTKEHPRGPAVVANTPAAIAGLKEKDIILEWNKTAVTEDCTIQDFLEDCSVGDSVMLKVLRNDSELNIQVKLAERK